jgi:hypothetical protein
VLANACSRPAARTVVWCSPVDVTPSTNSR